MAVVGIVALFKALLAKDWVLMLVGLLLVAAGIRGMRLLYARRPDWNGAYWAPPRRREVTRSLASSETEPHREEWKR